MDRAEAKAILETARATGIVWTSEASAAEHLTKRIEEGLLLPGSTVGDLDEVALRVLEADAKVYSDDVGGQGILVVAVVDEWDWALKLNAQGRVVTVFALVDRSAYVADPRRSYIGKATELLR